MSQAPLVRLGDCCEIVSGATPSTSVKHYWEGGIAWATPKDLSGLDSKYIDETPQTLTEEGYRSCSAKIMPAGSVLFSSRAPIGHVAINRVPMCTNQGFKSFVPDPKRVSADYLYYWLKNNKTYLQSLGNGATFKEVSKATVAEVKIPLPSIQEQHRIAAILDKADAIRAKRRETIAKLDQLLRSVFLDMFGDPLVNPKSWPLIPLTEVGDWKSGATPSKSEAAYWDGDFPWVSPKDMKVEMISDAQDHVSDLAFQKTNLKRIEPGHLLVVVRGMILAHSFPTAINVVPVAINQDMKAIFPKDGFDVVYLKAAVDCLKHRILSAVSSAGHGTCRLSTLDAAEVMVPKPPKDLQGKFKRQVDLLLKIRDNAKSQLEGAGQLFSALQAKAFSGAL